MSDLATRPLGELIKIKKGKKPASVTTSKRNDADRPYLLIESFGGEYRSFTDDLSCPYASKEDTLLVWDGERCGLTSTGHEGYIGSTLASISRSTGELEPTYLYHFLASKRKEIRNSAEGTGVPHVSRRFLEDIEIHIPPLPEQKKIAEILSGIDKRIKLARQRVSQLEALIKSLGRNYFGTANQYGMKSIGELFEISSGTTPSRARQDYFCRKDGIPWVKTMDLNDNYIRNTDECLTDLGVQEGKARIFPKGTLLVAMYGGWNQIGRTGILAQNSSCNQAMSALLPTKEVLPEFLNLQLIIRRSYWKGVAASSRKDPNITKSDVAEMPIVIPPVEDQLEIAKTLGSVMNSCQKEDRYLDSLNLLKQSVASDLLSGRKRVSV